MCEKLICDFCGHSLPENHFYSKSDPVVCNWCFGEMVGIRYDVNKSQFLDNGEDKGAKKKSKQHIVDFVDAIESDFSPETQEAFDDVLADVKRLL